jgi:hypothetical protein
VLREAELELACEEAEDEVGCEDEDDAGCEDEVEGVTGKETSGLERTTEKDETHHASSRSR